jgi:hypothetical protein
MDLIISNSRDSLATNHSIIWISFFRILLSFKNVLQSPHAGAEIARNSMKAQIHGHSPAPAELCLQFDVGLNHNFRVESRRGKRPRSVSIPPRPRFRTSIEHVVVTRDTEHVSFSTSTVRLGFLAPPPCLCCAPSPDRER